MTYLVHLCIFSVCCALFALFPSVSAFLYFVYFVNLSTNSLSVPCILLLQIVIWSDFLATNCDMICVWLKGRHQHWTTWNYRPIFSLQLASTSGERTNVSVFVASQELVWQTFALFTRTPLANVSLRKSLTSEYLLEKDVQCFHSVGWLVGWLPGRCAPVTLRYHFSPLMTME